jgi:hypothetical protein
MNDKQIPALTMPEVYALIGERDVLIAQLQKALQQAHETIAGLTRQIAPAESK